MSEPKTVATETQEIAPGIHHFRIHDERINHGSDGLAIVEDGRVVLVDPLPLDPAVLRRLGSVAAIILTSSGHQRCAWRVRRDTGAKVHAPDGVSAIDEKADVSYRDGDALPGGLRAVAVAGPKAPHYALARDGRPALLYVGDLVMHEPHGIVFLSDKYLEDPTRARASAARLADRRFDVLAFAHGGPITTGASAALQAALKKDAETRQRT